MNFLFKNSKARPYILLVFDMVCFFAVCTAYYLSTYYLEESPEFSLDLYNCNALILLGALVVFRFAFFVYSTAWRFTSTKAYLFLIFGDFCGGITSIIVSRAFGTYDGIWFFIDITALTCLVSIAARLTYRLIYKRRHLTPSEESGPAIKVAIVGAGQLGVLLATDLVNNRRSVYKPMFFIEKDVTKVGKRAYGLPVYHETTSVLEQIKRENISEIFIAIANLDSEEASRIYSFYSLTGCKIKIYDLPIRDTDKTGSVKPTIREFEIEDLLFREPVNIDDKEELKYYNGKTILVTGGGGSIGSELCRQIAKCAPKRLVIFDIYENNAYDIQQELSYKYPDLDLCVEIGSVRDRIRLDCIFANYRPNVVFHAAAHKHVPLMEQSGCEAIKNNVLGTHNTADMAEKYYADKFILISTDKAVNPTNIMGATKRLCEMVVQCRYDSQTAFAAVRFGNVLGSNGSVIPLFKRQIAHGGPVTITDKRIIRYFMTIPEAAQLVMTAGAMANKGELFVLDMGKPVRIYDLAKNMIRLSGFEPEVDIKIEEIGLRPGEKLYEELLMKNETLDKTDNNMIFIEKDAPHTREQVDEKLQILIKAVEASQSNLGSAKVKEAILKVVPTFREPGEINSKASDSSEMKSVR